MKENLSLCDIISLLAERIVFLRVVEGLEDLVAKPGSDLPTFNVLHEVFFCVSGQPGGLAEFTVALGCQKGLQGQLKHKKYIGYGRTLKENNQKLLILLSKYA